MEEGIGVPVAVEVDIAECVERARSAGRPVPAALLERRQIPTFRTLHRALRLFGTYCRLRQHTLGKDPS